MRTNETKYRVAIRSGGYWRRFDTGEIRLCETASEANQIIKNFMLDAQVEAVSVEAQPTGYIARLKEI